MNPTGCLPVSPSGQTVADTVLAQSVVSDYQSQITMWKWLFGIAVAAGGSIYVAKVLVPDFKMKGYMGKPRVSAATLRGPVYG